MPTTPMSPAALQDLLAESTLPIGPDERTEREARTALGLLRGSLGEDMFDELTLHFTAAHEAEIRAEDPESPALRLLAEARQRGWAPT